MKMNSTTGSANNIFVLENVSFKYSSLNSADLALDNVSLSFEQSCFTCLNGPSGSGKTTLLQLLGLVAFPRSGSIKYHNRNVSTLSDREINQIRLFDLGFIFQHFQLFPVLTVRENVEFFLVRQNIKSDERKARVEQALKSVGLWDLKDRYPKYLSGGQQQRVGVARAFAKSPKLILADEPTASLDQTNGKLVMSLLKEMQSKNGCGVVFTSHDPVMQSYAKTTISLLDGQVVV